MAHKLGGGQPRFRKGNQAPDGSFPKIPPQNQDEPADISDLEGKSETELKAIAAQEALKALISQTRRPTRHATAIVSSAGKLLEFSSSKPAQATTLSAPDGGPIQSRHEIVFVKPEEK